MIKKRDRIINPKIKEYLFQYVPDYLNSNPIFIKVFGKKFAIEKVKTNIDVAYTNGNTENLNLGGYYLREDKSITICISGKDGNLLTPQDLDNNEVIKEVGLHECIHAILERTKKECKKYGIIEGTGILEKRINNESNESYEIGRGLNEGYTEWMCEKAGFETQAFKELVDFVRLIEFAIGTEKTMEFGKGNINRRFPKLLNMSIDSINYLLSVSDQLLNNIYNYNYVENLIKYLEKDKNERQINEGLDVGITNYKNDPVFKRYLKDNNLDFSEENLKKYLSNVCIPELINQRNDSIIRFESYVLEQYYLKDLNKLLKSKIVTEEEFLKYKKIISVLNTDIENIPSYFKDINPKMTSIYIKEEYKEFSKKFIIQEAHELSEKYKNDGLSLQELLEKIYLLCDNDYNLKKLFFDEFSACLNDNFKEQISYFLLQNDMLEKEIKSEKNILFYRLVYPKEYNFENDVVISYDKNDFQNHVFGEQIDKNNDKINFDFTTDFSLENEYEIAIRNFLKLREEILKKDSNSKIYIDSRTLTVENKYGINFYRINKGEFVPMQIVDKYELKFSTKEKKQEQITIVPSEVGFFKKITNVIRSFFHSIKNQNNSDLLINNVNEISGKIIFNSSIYEEDKFENYRVNDFDERLSRKKKDNQGNKAKNNINFLNEKSI